MIVMEFVFRTKPTSFSGSFLVDVLMKVVRALETYDGIRLRFDDEEGLVARYGLNRIVVSIPRYSSTGPIEVRCDVYNLDGIKLCLKVIGVVMYVLQRR